MSKRILKLIQKKKITPQEALRLMYESKPKKGKYIKLRMFIKDHKFISSFINTLFFFPIPIWFGKAFIIKGLKKAELSPKMYNLTKEYSGGTSVIVKSEEAKIKLKII